MKTTSVELPALKKVDLDPPAEFLLNGYLSFLNSLILTQGLSAKDTVKEQLESKYAIVRELLFRLVAIGLSNDLHEEQDGKLLLEALRIFLASVNKNGLLTTKRMLLRSENSPFLIKLVSEHPQWLTELKKWSLLLKKCMLIEKLSRKA